MYYNNYVCTVFFFLLKVVFLLLTWSHTLSVILISQLGNHLEIFRMFRYFPYTYDCKWLWRVRLGASKIGRMSIKTHRCIIHLHQPVQLEVERHPNVSKGREYLCIQNKPVPMNQKIGKVRFTKSIRAKEIGIRTRAR